VAALSDGPRVLDTISSTKIKELLLERSIFKSCCTQLHR